MRKSKKDKLSDTAKIFSGYAFKSKEMDQNEGVPIIKIKNINFSKVSKICETNLEIKSFNKKFEKYILQENDILVAMTGQGSVGRIGKMLTVDKTYLVNQRVGIVRVDDQEADPEYVFQYLGRESIEKYYFNLAGGAGQPNLSPADIGNLKIDYPIMLEQKKIGAVLSNFDKLIDINQKKIDLLESLGKNIYQEWFVNFKVNNTKLNIDKKTNLPEGWVYVKVETLLKKIKSTKKIKNSEYIDNGKFPVVDQGTEFIGGYTNEENINYYSDIPFIVFGDHTRILKFINFTFAKGADGTVILVSNNEQMPQTLFYYSLSSIKLSNYHYARHLKFLKSEKIILPDKSIAKKFNKICINLFDEMKNLRNQNEILLEAKKMLFEPLNQRALNNNIN